MFWEVHAATTHTGPQKHPNKLPIPHTILQASTKAQPAPAASLSM